MEMELKRIYKRTLIAVVALSALSAFIEPVKLPLGVFLGGVLGLFNLRGLKRGLESFIGTYRPQGKLLVLSIFRLFILFAVIILLVKNRVVNPLGLLVGFTVVFSFLLLEGLSEAGKQSDL